MSFFYFDEEFDDYEEWIVWFIEEDFELFDVFYE